MSFEIIWELFQQLEGDAFVLLGHSMPLSQLRTASFTACRVASNC